MVKRTVEKFVFKMKVLLTECSAGEAFWLGALKHKDLAGRELPSQVGGGAGGAKGHAGAQAALCGRGGQAPPVASCRAADAC